MELSTTTLAIFAVFAVMGIVVVVATEIITMSEARCRAGGTGYNASQGKCNPG